MKTVTLSVLTIATLLSANASIAAECVAAGDMAFLFKDGQVVKGSVSEFSGDEKAAITAKEKCEAELNSLKCTDTKIDKEQFNMSDGFKPNIPVTVERHSGSKFTKNSKDYVYDSTEGCEAGILAMASDAISDSHSDWLAKYRTELYNQHKTSISDKF